MDQRQPLPEGFLLVNEYLIEEVLGVGGFAITYRAIDLSLRNKVAIKEYFPNMAVRDSSSAVRSRNDEDEKTYHWALTKFIEEARTLARFKHDNIVRVHRSFQLNNTAYMVLEYVEGRDFERWLKELGRPPTQDELDPYVAPLLDALSIVHSNQIWHRDVKPANIYIRTVLNSPVLLDFGAAKYAVTQHSMTTNMIVSRHYSPYESYGAENRQQGPWTDIYSFAATLHRAITGHPPSEAPNRVIEDDYTPLAEQRPLLDRYRRDFLRGIDFGLAVHPRQRPQSIAPFAALLVPTAATAATTRGDIRVSQRSTDDTATAVVTGPTGRPSRSRVVPVALAMSVVLAASGGAYWYMQQQEETGTNVLANILRPATPSTSSPTVPPVATPQVAESNALPKTPLTPSPTTGQRSVAPTVQAKQQLALAVPVEVPPVPSPAIAATPSLSAVPPIPPAAPSKQAAVVQPVAPPVAKALSGRPLPTKLPGPVLLALGEGHSAGVHATAFLAAGNVLGSAGGDGILRLWDIESGKSRDALPIEAGALTALAGFPDARRVAVGTDSGQLRIIDTEAKRVWEVKAHAQAVRAVAISPDGERIVTAGGGDVSVWDGQAQGIDKLVGVQGTINALAFAGDGRLVSGASGGIVQIWDLAKKAAVVTIHAGDRDIIGVQFTPDNNHLVVASNVGKIYAIASGDGEAKLTFDAREPIASFAIASDQSRMALGGVGGTVSVRGNDGQTLAKLEPHGGVVHAVAFSNDNRRLVTASSDHTLRLWGTEKWDLLQTLGQPEGSNLHAMAVPSDGQIVALSSLSEGPNELWTWEAEAQRPRRTVIGRPGRLTSMAIARSEPLVALGGFSDDITIWNLKSASLERTFPVIGAAAPGGSTASSVLSVAFMPDANRVVVATSIGNAAIWNWRTGERLPRDLEGHIAAVSPTGHRIATAVNRTVPELLIHDDEGRELARYQPHFDRITSLAFSPDGEWVVTGSADRTVRVTSLKQGPQQSFSGDHGGITAIAISGDGRQVLSASDDQFVQSWDFQSGRRIATYAGQTGLVRSIAFLPGERKFVTAAENGTLRIWETRN